MPLPRGVSRKSIAAFTHPAFDHVRSPSASSVGGSSPPVSRQACSAPPNTTDYGASDASSGTGSTSRNGRSCR